MAALGFVANWNVTRDKLSFVLIKSYSLFYVLWYLSVMLSASSRPLIIYINN